MTEAFWLWLYVAVMAAGACLFLYWSRKPRGVPGYEYTIAAVIPIWSGLAYLAMALGQGTVMIDGREVYYARYLDWLVTTPLLLWLLGSTATFYRANDTRLIGSLMFADVVMILSGLFADLTAEQSVRWLWYTIGCVSFLLILWQVWGPLRRIAGEQGEALSKTYTRVAAYLTVFWVSYPLVWLISPSGIGIVGPTVSIALFVILPAFSKVGFSILDLYELRRLGDDRPSPKAAIPPPAGHRAVVERPV
ncbi:bacteriorhodopsin [Parvularcula oceani]|uniref:bacteriorhodopsin n=1 Tax=Parvularcula oceani TaxID=1247963 RepID=UPI000689268D|nr:bacteriorhodopsin [Parvularcula oceani]